MNSRMIWFSLGVLLVALTVAGMLSLDRLRPGDAPDPEPGVVTSDFSSRPTSGFPASEWSRLAEPPTTAEGLERALVRSGAWENEALLTFHDRQSLAEFLALARVAGMEIAGPHGRALTLRARYASLAELAGALDAMEGEPPLVGPNFFVSVPRITAPPEEAGGVGTAPFDELLFRSMGIPEGADRSAWGDGVVVAVIDSGIGEHPTFRDGQVTRIDLVGGETPLHGHGTAMASLIGGNADAAPGIAPAAGLIDIRIAGEDGLSDSFLLAEGIQTAIDRKADIVNISLGTYGDSPVVAGVVAEALKNGILIVAPVGNERVGRKSWPAAYPGVISVSGIDATDQLAYFSNSGSPTLSAPAVGILSAYLADDQALIVRGQGTSQAAALVSGTLAHLKALGLNPQRALTGNTRAIGGDAEQFGVGALFLPGSLIR